MTIRTKLTLNVVIVILIIGAVSATSFVGMGFVKKKLSYLTERSTPFQMRTVEFQRAIQGVSADLLKVASARTDSEFASTRTESDRSLAEVKKTQDILETINGGEKIATHDELQSVASEIYTIIDARLKAEKNSAAASRAISGKLKEVTTRLKDLDGKIRNFQTTRSAAYAMANEEAQSTNSRLRNIEGLRLSLKDLQLAVFQAQRASTKKAVLIAQGKINAAIARCQQNPYLQDNKEIKSSISTLAEKIAENLKTQSASLSDPSNSDLKTKNDSVAGEVTEKLNALSLTIEQEIALASNRYGDETSKQGTLYKQSNIATAILAGNSELVSLGITIEGLVNRIFLASSEAEVSAVDGEIRKAYQRIASVDTSLAKALKGVKADRELKILAGVNSALDNVKGDLYAEVGIFATARKKLEMLEKSVKLQEKLRDIVLKQAEKSKQTVTVAQGEQEKAVATVNRMVRFSTSLIAAIGLGAIAFGILFGAWIYRSISRPLGQLIGAAEEVAQGHLSLRLDTGSGDEIGKVQASMGAMVGNLREIVGKIKDATQSLASSSEELSATANTLERGSEDQSSRVEQSAAAITEMAQTTTDVARNATDTSTAADQMKKIADQGKDAMHITVKELEKFAVTVKESATKVELLGAQSEEISNVVTLIKDIADQTNLLALNAAIEAARAGEQGRGFAVVADEVRALAEKTTSATDDIAKTVRQMQASVAESVTHMKDERDSVGSVLEHVNNTLRSIDDIVNYVGQVTDMVQRIAVAAEEQSSTSEDISRNMEDVAVITRELKSAFLDIQRSAGDLSQLAVDLNGMVGWFKV